MGVVPQRDLPPRYEPRIFEHLLLLIGGKAAAHFLRGAIVLAGRGPLETVHPLVIQCKPYPVQEHAQATVAKAHSGRRPCCGSSPISHLLTMNTPLEGVSL